MWRAILSLVPAVILLAVAAGPARAQIAPEYAYPDAPMDQLLIGVPHGDTAGAAAMLVIGSYEAANDVAIDSGAFTPVVEQLRASIAASQAYRLCSPGLRRELSEHRVRITRTGLSFAGAAPEIEAVGFYTRVSIGYGGMVLTNPTPIVLFRSGLALLDMKNLNDPAGIESNRKTDPGDWTRWRRVGRAVERLDRGRWRKLEWTAQHGPLPRGFELDRTYRSLSGVGSSIGPGSSNGVAWRSLAFDRSGRFTTQGGAGATAGGVVARSESGTEGGRYEVAGFTLTLCFDDGKVTRRSLVADPKDPDVIWIDGAGYTSR